MSPKKLINWQPTLLQIPQNYKNLTAGPIKYPIQIRQIPTKKRNNLYPRFASSYSNTYRDISEFPPGRLIGGGGIEIVFLRIRIFILPVLFRDRGPPVKHEGGGGVTVAGNAVSQRGVLLAGGGVVVVGAGRNVDPLLLPPPHRAGEDGGGAVAAGGSA